MTVKTAGTQALSKIARHASQLGMQTRVADDLIGNLAPYAGHVLASTGTLRVRGQVHYYQVTAHLRHRKGQLVKVRFDVIASDWHKLPELSI